MPFLRSATSMLLSALVLTAAVAPPAVRHVHALAGGSRLQHEHSSHRHGPGHDRHSQGIESSGQHGELTTHLPPMNAEVVASGVVWHLHLLLLGVEVTLPDRSPDNEDRRSQPGCEFALLRSGDDLLLQQSGGSMSVVSAALQSLPTSQGNAAPLQLAPPILPKCALCHFATVRATSGPASYWRNLFAPSPRLFDAVGHCLSAFREVFSPGRPTAYTRIGVAFA